MDICIISLYVDDLVIAASSLQTIQYVKDHLQQFYLMKDLGVIDEILGCKVIINHELECVTIQQSQYTTEIISKFLQLDDHIISTIPADSSLILSESHCPTTDDELHQMKSIPYRQAVGSLLWLAMGTRPDISYAVGQVAKYNRY